MLSFTKGSDCKGEHTGNQRARQTTQQSGPHLPIGVLGLEVQSLWGNKEQCHNCTPPSHMHSTVTPHFSISASPRITSSHIIILLYSDCSLPP